jgi:TubC N-terminal docking domain
MNAAEILNELSARNVRPLVIDGKLKLRGPADRVTPELVERVRAHKAELLAVLAAPPAADAKAAITHTGHAPEALTLIARLRGYTLPAGWMPAARAIAERLCPLLTAPEMDPAQALAALQNVEAELVALGGTNDADLAEAIGLLTGTLPDTKLLGVRTLR